MLRLPGVRRSRSRADPSVRVVGPSQDEVWLCGTSKRQSLLAQCDRSPSIFRLAVAYDGPAPARGRPRQGADRDLVAVVDRDGRHLGTVPPTLARSYAIRLRRLHRRGVQIAVHGQVVRRELDLCVVLHCPAPSHWAERWNQAAR